MTMVHNLPIEWLTFRLMHLSNYEYRYLVVSLLLKFLPLNFIAMAIETVSFYVLWLVAVAVVSYLAWRWKSSVDCQLLGADLNGQRMARRELQRRYDELYDAFLRVNKLNTELNKKIASIPPTYEDCADQMVAMLNTWLTRHEIADRFGVNYSTTCLWIRKKLDEPSWEYAVLNVHQAPLV